MQKRNVLAGFALACFVFGATAMGASLAIPFWKGIVAEASQSLFAGFYLLVGLLWCSGILAALAIFLGALSWRILAGKLAALGGLGIFIGLLAWYFWNG